MSYPSNSLTETMISAIQAFGAPTPTSYGLGELMRDLDNAIHAGGGTDTQFNVKTFGAIGNGVADDTGAINAAMTAANAIGGIVLFPPTIGGTWGIDGRVVIPGNVRVVAQGSGWLTGSFDVAPHTVIKCLSSGAGVDVYGGSGGSCEHFTIDGNNVATSPLRDGTSGVQFSEDRTWISVYVINSAEDGWAILGTQNSTYINCRSNGNARDNLSIDGNAGGLNFFNFKETDAGRYSVAAPNLVSGGPYGNITGDVTFFGGILDAGGAPTSKVFLRAAVDWAFVKTPIVGNGCTGPVCDIDVSTCNNVDFGKSIFYAPTGGGNPGHEVINVHGTGPGVAYIDISGCEFVEGDTSIYVQSGATVAVIGYGTGQDFTTNKAVGASGIDINLVLGFYIGQWITPTLTGGWVTLSGYENFQYRISQDHNHIEFAGAIEGGVDGSVVFTLPAQYRPTTYRLQLVPVSGGVGYVLYNSGTFQMTINQLTGSSAAGVYFFGLSMSIT